MTKDGQAKHPIDDGARQYICSEFDRSLTVEAGAGTGKTTVLVARLLNLVKQRRARFGELCAITFTEKAAGELRLRIREELERQLVHDQEHRQFWERTLNELSQATISTIHSFAARLLRERPIEAGVDPNFEQHDRIQGDLFWEDCWQEWLTRELGQEPFAPAVQRGLRYGMTLHQLRSAARELTRHRDVLRTGSTSEAGEPSIRAFRRQFCAEIEELAQFAAVHCTNRDVDKGYRKIMRLKEFADRLAELEPEAALDALLNDFDFTRHRVGSIKNWDTRDASDYQKEWCLRLLDEREDFLQRFKSKTALEVVDWLWGFVEHFQASKQRQNVLDFDDLLLKARDLIAEHPEVRREFYNTYRYILVDEFQDTDPLQAEIVFMLTDGAEELTDWEQAAPEPGRLFIVGDPKQSIYRFRRADIELYEAARRKLADDEDMPTLVQNFRSVPAVVEWVNHVFARLIERPDNGYYQPDYVGIEHYREEVPGSGVTVLYPPSSLDLTNYRAKEVRRCEADYLAALIRERIEDKEWLVEDASGEYRPAEYRDVGMLFPARTGRQLFEEALRRHEIPYLVEGGREFFRTQEVQSFSQLLWALENPHDEVAVVAALRSEFFGCSDAALFRWRANGGRFHLRAEDLRETSSGSSGGTAVAESLGIMAGLHRQRRELSPPELIEKVFEKTRILESRLLMGLRGERAAANLLKVLDRARYFYLNEQKTSTWFARWLRDMRREEVDEEESPVLEEGQNAVQLLTIHKAKGLEFPVTVLANLTSLTRNPGHPVVVDRQTGRYEVSIGARKNGFETPGYDAALEAEKLRQSAEQRRLFYVAATRARDHLVLPLFYSRENNMGPLQKYAVRAGVPHTAEAYAETPEEDLPPGMDAVGGEELAPEIGGKPGMSAPAKLREQVLDNASKATGERLAQRKDKWRSQRSDLLQEAARGLTIVTPSGAVDWEQLGDAEELVDEPGQIPAGGVLRQAESAAAFGSAFHTLLERLPLPLMRELAGRQVLDTGELPPEVLQLAETTARDYELLAAADELLQLLTSTLGMPFMKEAQARADRLQWLQELPISTVIDGVLVEGKLDLVLLGEAGTTIIDYKTDRIETEDELAERAAHYRPQGALYALMVEHAAGAAVDEVVFAFVRAGQEARITADSSLLTEAKKNLNRIATKTAKKRV